MIVPLALPGVVTAAILIFLFAWNDFLFGISLTSSDRGAPGTGRARLLHGRFAVSSQPTAAISAAAVVVTVPVVVLTLLFQRKIMAGLTSGAVKG